MRHPEISGQDLALKTAEAGTALALGAGLVGAIESKNHTSAAPEPSPRPPITQQNFSPSRQEHPIFSIDAPEAFSSLEQSLSPHEALREITTTPEQFIANPSQLESFSIASVNGEPTEIITVAGFDSVNPGEVRISRKAEGGVFEPFEKEFLDTDFRVFNVEKVGGVYVAAGTRKVTPDPNLPLNTEIHPVLALGHRGDSAFLEIQMPYEMNHQLPNWQITNLVPIPGTTRVYVTVENNYPGAREPIMRTSPAVLDTKDGKLTPFENNETLTHQQDMQIIGIQPNGKVKVVGVEANANISEFWAIEKEVDIQNNNELIVNRYKLDDKPYGFQAYEEAGRAKFVYTHGAKVGFGDMETGVEEIDLRSVVNHEKGVVADTVWLGSLERLENGDLVAFGSVAKNDEWGNYGRNLLVVTISMVVDPNTGENKCMVLPQIGVKFTEVGLGSVEQSSQRLQLGTSEVVAAKIGEGFAGFDIENNSIVYFATENGVKSSPGESEKKRLLLPFLGRGGSK